MELFIKNYFVHLQIGCFLLISKRHCVANQFSRLFHHHFCGILCLVQRFRFCNTNVTLVGPGLLFLDTSCLQKSVHNIISSETDADGLLECLFLSWICKSAILTFWDNLNEAFLLQQRSVAKVSIFLPDLRR